MPVNNLANLSGAIHGNDAKYDSKYLQDEDYNNEYKSLKKSTR